MSAHSPSVHALLRHLESVSFPYSPRFLGIDDKGRVKLSRKAALKERGEVETGAPISDEGEGEGRGEREKGRDERRQERERAAQAVAHRKQDDEGASERDEPEQRRRPGAAHEAPVTSQAASTAMPSAIASA